MYLFIYYTIAEIPPEREKKEGQERRVQKRKGIEAQRGKPSIPARATDALRGEKEQNGKQKKNKK